MSSSFIDSFATAAALYSNKPAVIFHTKTLSYQELNQRSNDLSENLIGMGVHKEEVIPLILERDVDTIIAMIAVLKAGCAFLPISPTTPCARIKFILEDTNANYVISNINIEHLICEKIKIIRPSEIQTSNQSNTPTDMESQLAYVMYTSGSTGNPKGVLIERGSMMNLFSSMINQLNLTEQELFLALTDYTFDISLIELLMPLLCGSTILLTEQGTVADGVKIKLYIEKNNITFMQATPLTWEILLKQGWKNNTKMKILVGGEKFKTKLAMSLDYEQGNIWNMYGPTETSMWSMLYHLNEKLFTESVPLGSPLKNTEIKILDNKMNQVEMGEQGELYIGGKGLARGYLNSIELTQEKFLYHPSTQARLYKTGDLAIAHNKNIICYVGRTDDQLKFGGIRIEAGEIESVIEQEPFVKKAIVKIHETEGYYKSLAAYIEVDEEKIFSNGIQGTNYDISNFLKNIYDETYCHAENYEYGRVNNCGWQSSFTGRLLSAEELNESYCFIREIINKAELSNILEVGCGTGSLLLEYIDKADECTVVEISSKAIDYVQKKLTHEQLHKITFKNESILNIHDHEKYSCVIVNSVVQYLPSIHSLIVALTQLVIATKSGGTIIIGDVRSLELMDLYLLEKIRNNNATAEELALNLNALYYKSRDAEIVLSPKFFYALKGAIKDIAHVDISVKHGLYQNELNYFRYDVIIHVNKTTVHQLPIVIQYENWLNEHALEKIISLNQHQSLIISKIPNIPIQKLLKKIDANIPHYITQVETESDFNDETTKQITSIINFEAINHERFVHYDETDPVRALKICFHPKDSNQIYRCLDTNEYENIRSYCREPFNPWLQKFCFDHVKLKVSQHVVSWVNPSVYVWIEKWPLTINGKLDKKKLQLPISLDCSPSETSILAQLQTIWRNITGDNALVDKEFWVHGISSLCMYFFLATINETFFININYHEFRDYNTLDKLACYIEQLLDISST